jgi:hypothetical protein
MIPRFKRARLITDHTHSARVVPGGLAARPSAGDGGGDMDSDTIVQHVAMCDRQNRIERRARRVVLLLLAVVSLSIADLILTIAHLRTTGMIEANPIAAYILHNSNSLWTLGLYKGATVAVSVLLLFRLRDRVQGEIAAWIAAAILALLCLHWHQYAAMLDDINPVKLAQAGEQAESWLIID